MTEANKSLWKEQGAMLLLSLGMYAALFLIMEAAELLWADRFAGRLLQWASPAFCVGIPASILGTAYVLTVRNPQNYTGFFAGIIMSILLGIQFVLQGGYDSAFLFFMVFIPFQMMSIYKWSRNKEDGGASFEPKFLDTPRLILSIAMLIFITVGDWVMASIAIYHEGIMENVPVKLLNGLLISSSFLANYWLIYRKTDSWIYWFIYSVAGIGLFIILGNIFSIVLFTFFLVINSMAGIAWIKATKPENLYWAKIFVKK
jgi:nicotinamide mononucleotide transporter PnuC